jgi:hypothetical protein
MGISGVSRSSRHDLESVARRIQLLFILSPMEHMISEASCTSYSIREALVSLRIFGLLPPSQAVKPAELSIGGKKSCESPSISLNINNKE